MRRSLKDFHYQLGVDNEVMLPVFYTGCDDITARNAVAQAENQINETEIGFFPDYIKVSGTPTGDLTIEIGGVDGYGCTVCTVERKQLTMICLDNRWIPVIDMREDYRPVSFWIDKLENIILYNDDLQADSVVILVENGNIISVLDKLTGRIEPAYKDL